MKVNIPVPGGNWLWFWKMGAGLILGPGMAESEWPVDPGYLLYVYIWVVVSNMFLFSPLFGEDEPILTNIFQMGWNHQLVFI